MPLTFGVTTVYVRFMAHRFTSIGYVFERLQECEYFLGRMAHAGLEEFKFELNAFLSSSRSVTFVFQKSLAHVPQFGSWYEKQRCTMKSDAAMGFFLELRNVSQKQGPVSYVAGSTRDGGVTYRFVSVGTRVPACLVGRDIGDCCAEHLQKLATLVLNYYREYPFNACIAQALSVEGMAALEFTLADVEVLLGFPSGYVQGPAEKFPVAETLRILRGEVDGIDVADLERLAAGNFEAYGERITFPTGHGIVDEMARLIDTETDAASKNPRVIFLKAALKRIGDLENQ